MKKFIGSIFTFVILAATVLSAAVFDIGAQTRRSVKRVTQVKPATSIEPEYGLVAGEPNRALSSAWSSGVLPAPLPAPSANTDESIAALAQKIAAKSDESIPALMTALQLAGFFVTNADGSVLLAPKDGKGQGLTINAWEVAGSAKMFGAAKTISLDDLGATLKSIPAFKNTDPSALIMQGIRANAVNDANPYLRAWARLILELQKHHAVTESSAARDQARSETIDAIQHLLILRRLYGDVSALALRYRMQPTGFPAAARNIVPTEMPRLYGASYYRPLSDATVPDDPKAIPCRMDGNAPTVMDAGATLIGTGYGELMGYLQNVFEDTPTGTALERVGTAQAVANILLVYAKFIQTYAALDIKLSLEGEPPLIRTKNAAPGERKNLKAELRMNIGNWQMYNCVRLAMNLTAGIDFATVNDGPIGDVGVTWSLAQGGGRDEYSNRTGVNQGVEQIVGFTQDGPRIQEPGTIAGPGANGVQVGNARYTKTDANGIARIILEGSPQKNHKNYRSRPVMKHAVVYTTVKIKAGEIKGDLVDVAGQALGGEAGLITMPAELLYRVSWFASGKLKVPVKDWEDCNAGWSGSISAVTRYHKDEPVKSSGNLTEAKQYKDWVEKWDITLTGEQNRSGGLVNGFFAKGTAEHSETNWVRNFYAESLCSDAGRGNRIVRGQLTKIYERKDSAKGPVETTVYISTGGTSGSLTASFPEIVGETVYVQKYTGPCPLENFNNTSNKKSDIPHTHQPSGLSLTIEIDPKNPDVLQGSKTVKNSDGSETTYTWNLTFCR